VDVGNLPKAKAEQYMYSLMNQYRNKMVYDSKTGTMKDDRKFQTMLEDYWMPRRNGCFDLSTKISLLDGRNVELGQLIVEHKAGKENWTYSVDQKGHVVPGLISWAGVTRNDAEVLDVHLDNGEIITATPDHKFILRNGERIEASNLTEGSSLMPFNTKRKAVSPNNQTKEYLQVQHNDTEKYEFVHRAVSEFINRPQEKTEVIHHIDLDRFNNTPSNLKIMDRNEHIELHDENHQDEDAIIQNHTVVKVVRRTDRMDVGTLTIDGEHQYHDYHNFALSSGIFVMNSATTEIDTIQGSEANFTQLDELEYFQRQLFRSLNVPISRMQPESGFSLGRASEISREEYKFLRFIERLRNRFSMLFIELLKKQLVLKNIMSLKQWEEIKSKIHFVFDQDSNFNSLKNLELLSEKMNVLREAEEYRGKYFSANYIRKEILAQTDEDIERIDDEIEEERYDSKFGMQQGEDGMGGEMGGGFGGGDAFGGLGPEPAGGAPLGATPEEGGMENDLAPEPTDTTINPGV